MHVVGRKDSVLSLPGFKLDARTFKVTNLGEVSKQDIRSGHCAPGAWAAADPSR